LGGTNIVATTRNGIPLIVVSNFMKIGRVRKLTCAVNKLQELAIASAYGLVVDTAHYECNNMISPDCVGYNYFISQCAAVYRYSSLI